MSGSPSTVGGHFSCSYNELTSLEGGPSTVGDDFNCNSNKLTSLEGSPNYVGGDFYCSGNKLGFDKLSNAEYKQLIRERKLNEILNDWSRNTYNL